METKYPAHAELLKYKDPHADMVKLIAEFEALKAKADLVDELVEFVQACKQFGVVDATNSFKFESYITDLLTKANKLTNGE